MQDSLYGKDVAVIRGGLAGAAAIHLAKAGFSVLCIEASPESSAIVVSSPAQGSSDIRSAIPVAAGYVLSLPCVPAAVLVG